MELDWGNKDHIQAVDPPYDFVIGTDVVGIFFIYILFEDDIEVIKLMTDSNWWKHIGAVKPFSFGSVKNTENVFGGVNLNSSS